MVTIESQLRGMKHANQELIL